MLNFYRGLESSYKPSVHGDGIYFATDTLKIINDNKNYSGSPDVISEIQIDTLLLSSLHIKATENVIVNSEQIL